jgi:hypothetical protein
MKRPKRYQLKTPNRYELAPQMRDYDAIRVNWVSYLMFMQTRGFRSVSVNIDERGLRYSPRTAADGPVRLLVGGSAAFGVGASSDNKTISSFLEQKSGVRWLNFGGRAYNSTQELILYQFLGYDIEGVDRIVLFSGVNDAYLPHLTRAERPEVQVMFFGSDYLRAMTALKNLTWPRQVARLVFENWVDADFSKISLVELLRRALLSREHGSTDHANHAIDPAVAEASAIAHLRRNLSLWKALADSRSIKLKFVLQPASSWVGKGKAPEEEAIFAELDTVSGVLGELKILDGLHAGFAKGAQSSCAELGIDFLDINPLFKRSSKDFEWLFVDRVHLTDAGNELAANILLENGVA